MVASKPNKAKKKKSTSRIWSAMMMILTSIVTSIFAIFFI
jgi:hypothetical protein